jgi:hypothetical protein
MDAADFVVGRADSRLAVGRFERDVIMVLGYR